MVLCPNCSHENEDDARFCNRCGTSLAAAPPAETVPTEPQPALPAPALPPVPGEQPSPAPAAQPAPVEAAPVSEAETPRREEPKSPVVVPLVLALVAVVGIGALLFVASRPAPCDGKFSSDKFGYCLAVPEGWSAGPASIGTEEVDQFVVPNESTTVIVSAVDLPDETDLKQFAQQARQTGQTSGLTPGEMHDRTLGGEQALEWQLSATTSTGQNFRLQQVVTVKNHVGWSVTFTDSAQTFADHRTSFEHMLQSWAFN